MMLLKQLQNCLPVGTCYLGTALFPSHLNIFTWRVISCFLKYIQCDVDHDIINHHEHAKLQNENLSFMEDFKHLL